MIQKHGKRTGKRKDNPGALSQRLMENGKSILLSGGASPLISRRVSILLEASSSTALMWSGSWQLMNMGVAQWIGTKKASEQERVSIFVEPI
jgi:hypothetical protein